MLAVCEGHIDFVNLLLSHPETDPNLAESHGESPVYCAALKNREHIMRTLCADSRVDVNQRWQRVIFVWSTDFSLRQMV